MAFSGAMPTALPMQVSPVGNALSNIYQNQTAQAQAAYAPAQAQANAYLAQQQANWLPYQYKMNALSNPILWQAAAADKTGNLQNQLMTMMSNPMQGTGTKPPQPTNSLLGLLMNKIGGNVPSDGNQSQDTTQSSVTNALSAFPSAIQQSNGNMGLSAGASNVPTSTIGNIGQGSPLSGNNPMAIAGAQTAGLNTTATTEAAAQQEMWKDRYNRSIDAANAQQQNINLSNKLKDSYSNLSSYERGQAFGHLPAFSTAAQDTDAAQNALADSVAKAQQEGHITTRDRDIYSAMKPGRTMTPDALNDQVNFIQGMGERMEEKPAFYIAAQKQGLNPEQADAVWINYAKNRPFFNSKTNSIMNDNLNTWQDYLTPQKIAASLNPSEGKALNIPENTVKNTPSPQGFKLPSFKNPAEFQSWYQQQTPDIQQQVKSHLGG